MNIKDILTSNAIVFQVIGRVQGVGFRPFVYKLANELGIKGNVFNRPDGIIIHVEGNPIVINEFRKRLSDEKPIAAEIKQIIESSAEYENFHDFKILPSQQSNQIITEICPDIAVCADCVKELKVTERRVSYPFNNCTNCGPRFTIIKDFPYDRERTSMNEFAMCENCLKEYNNPDNRRFHAQPVSCSNCGPVYSYFKAKYSISDNQASILQIAEDINSGKIVAIKGLGGYNLACDAGNSKSVSALRRFKNREKKPFAVMFRSIEEIESIAKIDKSEKRALQSWQRPIVILKMKERGLISELITSGLPTIGAFLPYLPLHYILFEKLVTNAIILTSGNESDTPILYQDDKALQTFRKISGGILTHNREIVNRIDDSVVKVINNNPVIFRRARGYIPVPIDLDVEVDGILAAGAELSNCFCLGKNNQAILSQHIGDLQNLETYEFYNRNIREFSSIYRTRIHTIACDLHPDYLSTRYAEESGFDVFYTQHHHAHIAACMAEYGLNTPVIGLSYDGSGLGTDGNIWGGELMIADFNDFKRISHFEYIPLPGGDQVVSQPWRTALSYLYHALGNEWQIFELPFLRKLDPSKTQTLIDAIKKNINTSLSCSAGRLFDAVSALLCICTESNYHAEAPMLLENFINPTVTDIYTIQGTNEISFKNMIQEIVTDILKKEKKESIVTKFHNTVAMAACIQAEFARSENNTNTVVLSGGCFQNKYLTEKLLYLLKNKGFETYFPRQVPVNDGGIALGQLVIAANKLK